MRRFSNVDTTRIENTPFADLCWFKRVVVEYAAGDDKTALAITQWFDDRELMVSSSWPSHARDERNYVRHNDTHQDMKAGVVRKVYEFFDTELAMMFKLTFGGQNPSS